MRSLTGPLDMVPSRSEKFGYGEEYLLRS
eukprot:COSAG06_NODE_24871_length_650_cov_1.114338_2_plen_28_part_01